MTQAQIAEKLRRIEGELRDLRGTLVEPEQFQLLPPSDVELHEITKWHGLNCPCHICRAHPSVLPRRSESA